MSKFESLIKYARIIIESTNDVVNEATTFHNVKSVVHHKIRITDAHKEVAKSLKDGQTHNASADHLVTTYDHAQDTGTSHFVKSTREGNVVHLHDRNTGKHVDTISHKELSN